MRQAFVGEDQLAQEKYHTGVLLSDLKADVLRLLHHVGRDPVAVLGVDSQPLREIDVALKVAFGVRRKRLELVRTLEGTGIHRSHRKEKHVLERAREEALHREERVNAESAVTRHQQRRDRLMGVDLGLARRSASIG